jgi:hypothetical protein
MFSHHHDSIYSLFANYNEKPNVDLGEAILHTESKFESYYCKTNNQTYTKIKAQPFIHMYTTKICSYIFSQVKRMDECIMEKYICR